MNLNKKGFTLIELIGAIIILVLLFVLTVTRVRTMTDKSKKRATKASAISFAKATNDLVSINNADPKNDLIEGFYTVQSLYDVGVNLNGKKPTGGYVYIYDNKIYAGCFEQDGYRLNYQNGEYKDPIEGACPTTNGYNKVLKQYSYKYKGSEESVTLNEPGIYILEAWGAEGGSANATYKGGKGGYSRTSFELQDGESITLYINVGGSGSSNCNRANCAGGYNGGANTGSGSDSAAYYGAGAGATSIAMQSGLLSTLSANQNKVLLVAAGGGGASYINNSLGNNGGNAGGYVGNNSLENSANKLYYGSGGTQSMGGSSSFANSNAGSFGLGGAFVSAISNVASAGGGAGLYGGGYAGGGGSSYFATSFTLSSRSVETTNNVMVCNKCSSNGTLEYKTRSTNSSSETPKSSIPKNGDGFARITRINN